MATTDIRGLAMLHHDELHPSPTNPRERMTGIDELAASITQVGLIQPIVVQKIPGQDGFQIVAGHRRHVAARKAGLDKIPCVVRRDMLPDEELLAMLVENGQRADLDPIEEARALSRLGAQGLSMTEIARKIGRSLGTVRSRLDLLSLPIEEQEAIRAGAHSLTYAGELARTQRREERRAANPVARPMGRPKGAKTKPYFGDTHPLAKTARARCSHIGTPKIAGVACGPCIEAVIRADERERSHADQAEAS